MRSVEQELAFQMGRELSPLFIGYALFIAECAVRDRPDQLFFLTREGEFFHRVFTNLFPDGHFAGHKLPTASVLCVSRIATFSASIKNVTPLEFNRIWSLFSAQKISTLFAILDIDPEIFTGALSKFNLSPDDIIVDPTNDLRILEFFNHQKFVAAAHASISSKRKLLEIYLAQNGINPGQKIGFVDIGWRGTIQDNIALLLPNNNTVGYYLGLKLFLNDQPTNTSKYAFGPDERISRNSKFFETFEPLELLCNSSNGNVAGYKVDGNRIVPIRQLNGAENAVVTNYTRYFQDGVMDGISAQEHSIQYKLVSSNEMRDVGFNLWNTISSKPPNELLEAYFATPQDDQFGAGGFFDRSESPSVTMLIQAVFSLKTRRQIIQYVKRSQWIAAVSGMKISQSNKLALKILLGAARYYKLVRQQFRN
jgi:uncharacterized membrane protein